MNAMSKSIGILVIGVVFINIQPIEAATIRMSLTDSEGQLLVERFFAGTEFNTGDWGNDISLLLPFKWNSGKDQFTLFSMAEHVRTYEAHWPPYQIIERRLRYRKYEWTQERSVDFLPSELYEIQYSSGKK